MSFGEKSSFVRRDLFGGRGAVQVWDLLGREVAPPFTAVLGCELEPGGSVGPHRQQDFPELVLGLGGLGQATVDGVPHRLGPGDVVYLPLGAALALENPGEEVLRYLIIKASASSPSR
jgi:quercetin dioxygenase-like cupin family protein